MIPLWRRYDNTHCCWSRRGRSQADRVPTYVTCFAWVYPVYIVTDGKPVYTKGRGHSSQISARFFTLFTPGLFRIKRLKGLMSMSRSVWNCSGCISPFVFPSSELLCLDLVFYHLIRYCFIGIYCNLICMSCMRIL